MKYNRSKTTVSNKHWARYLTVGAAGAAAAFGAQNSVDADVNQVYLNEPLVDNNPLDGNFSFAGLHSPAPGVSFRIGFALDEIGPGLGVVFIEGFHSTNASFSIAADVGGVNNYVLNLASSSNVINVPPGSWMPGNPNPPAPPTNLFVQGGNRGDMAWGAGYAESNFTSAGTGFIGFRFNVGAGTQYGFIHVEMNGAPNNTGTLVGYAYEKDPDTPIHVRPIPEPGALGILALGGIGLLAWRRKRVQDAA